MKNIMAKILELSGKISPDGPHLVRVIHLYLSREKHKGAINDELSWKIFEEGIIINLSFSQGYTLITSSSSFLFCNFLNEVQAVKFNINNKGSELDSTYYNSAQNFQNIKSYCIIHMYNYRKSYVHLKFLNLVKLLGEQSIIISKMG